MGLPYSFVGCAGLGGPYHNVRGDCPTTLANFALIYSFLTMLANYLPILIFIIIAVLLGVGMIAAGAILGPRRPDSEKLSPYECGFEAFEDSRMKFDVRYYLVAILFIIFDLEIAFLFPWAIVLEPIGLFGFTAMLVFLGILVVGFIYEWKKGALEWE